MDSFVLQNRLVGELGKQLTTGYFFFDMMIIILLSSLISKLIGGFSSSNLGALWKKMVDLIFGEYAVVLEHRYSKSKNGGWFVDPDSHDDRVIISAIKLYLANVSVDFRRSKIKLAGRVNSKNIYNDLMNRKINLVPNQDIKLEAPYSDIKLTIHEFNNQDADQQKIHYMKITSRKSVSSIRKFIEEAYKFWIDSEFGDYKENTKFFYTHYYENGGICYNKYPLQPSKTFNDIFFPEKQNLIKILDKKKVDKVSLLLHGPPGTGKTSVIKAIINHTGRSAIYVKLSDIKNIMDLYQVFFGESISEKKGNTYDVKIKDRLLILEDIDVENTVTRGSSGSSSSSGSGSGNDSDSDSDSDNDDDKKTKTGELTLSDILQVFDGVYECSDLMIVMTTNHIERLDKALIRPGRITKKILLGELTTECALNLIRHRMEINHLDDRFNKVQYNRMTPAYLEQLCDDSDNLDQLYNRLVL